MPARPARLDGAHTLPRAEQAAGRFVAILRVATLVQMLPSLVTAVEVSDWPALCAVTWALAIVAVLVISAVSLFGRRPPGTRWATADVCVAALLLVLGLLTVPIDLRIGSWVGFQSAYSLSVACSLIGVRARRPWLALVGLIVVARAVYLAPVLATPADLPTVLGELLTVLLLAPLARAGTGALYRIASDADKARDYAAALAREAEERRARTAIHNGAALMRLLVEQADQSSPDSRTPSQVWVQAAAELNRMRAYLAGSPGQLEGDPEDLADLVTGVAGEFADLPLDVVADLARGVHLGDERADVAGGLRSLLINARQHAHATRVVLHAEELEDAGGWAITLHDDGVGFDPATTPLGVGIQTLVIDQLAEVDVRVALDSVPGLGTTVTLTRRLEGAR